MVMRNVLPVSLVMGVIVGLLVAGYFNVFNVPVMEWAISLEEAAAEAEGAAAEEAGTDSFLGGFFETLGAQRVGMSVGLAVAGVLFGAIFTGLYHLVRRAAPGWNMWAWGTIAGLLGFWSVSLFSQIQYPMNPPGIGDEGSLLARQGFQFLFILISLAAAAGLCLAAKVINESRTSGVERFIRYAGAAIAYAVVALVIVYAIPGNRDSIPEWVPDALIIMFRTFTIIGHFLLWMGISLGVVGYIRYKERAIKAHPNSSDRAAEPASHGASVG
jgi:hypothetical protein